MRTISFHKKGIKCLKCGINPVRRWNDTCKDCKVFRKHVKKQGASIGKRLPAAIIKTDDGKEIFVDKLGKEVKDHNYDLKNDPRGYKTTGRDNSKIII